MYNYIAFIKYIGRYYMLHKNISSIYRHSKYIFSKCQRYSRISLKTNFDYVELFYKLLTLLLFRILLDLIQRCVPPENDFSSSHRSIVESCIENVGFCPARRSPSGKSRKVSGEKAVGSFHKLHLHPPGVLVKEKYSAEREIYIL